MDDAFPRSARICIVGAGPAGMATALALAHRGVDDVVLLDAADFPRDKTCGSGLSPAAIATLRELGIWDEVEPLAYGIEGMRLTTPSGTQVDLPAEGVEAAVCLRRTLDHAILRAAIDRGVSFVPRFRAHALVEEGGRVVGVRDREGVTVRAEHTVIATGALAPLCVTPTGHTRIMTIMGWWDGVDFRDHWLEMVYDAEIAPYYGWLFPEDDGRVNIGITYLDGDRKRNARTLFEGFLQRHYGLRMTKAERVGALRGHPVHTQVVPPALHTPGRWVVGEAGRMVNPATAEGIGPGLRSGILLADALANVVRGRSERLAAATYRARCIATFSPGFLASTAFLRAVDAGWMDTLLGDERHPRWAALTKGMFVKM